PWKLMRGIRLEVLPRGWAHAGPGEPCIDCGLPPSGDRSAGAETGGAPRSAARAQAREIGGRVQVVEDGRTRHQERQERVRVRAQGRERALGGKAFQEARESAPEEDRVAEAARA